MLNGEEDIFIMKNDRWWSKTTITDDLKEWLDSRRINYDIEQNGITFYCTRDVSLFYDTWMK